MNASDDDPNRADDSQPFDESALDRALDRGFADASLPSDSVIERIAEVTGRKPAVSLRPANEGEHTPMLKPLGTDDARHTGKYTVQGELGRGGVGTVHKGHDQELGRDVAMKFLHDRYKDEPSILHRFVEEAQIGGQLQHPGIVPVYDLGMSGGKPFFTMKLVKGQTLAKKLADRQSPAEDRAALLAIFEDICQTMAYAHDRGVVHRDLKPANVMIGSFGEVQVVDWGMGKVLKSGGVEDERLAAEAHSRMSVIETVRSSGHGTQSIMGSVMGTPAYMPPEQARGDVEAMDERSDVFALGAILCEILTGQPPYVGAPDELIALAATARLADAEQRLAACGADPALVELAHQCLAPAPAARPRTAEVVARTIHDYLAGIEARVADARIEAAEAKVRAAGMKRTQRLGALLLVAVAAGLAVSLWFWRGAERELRRATEIKALITGMLEGVTPEKARDADKELLTGILDEASVRIESDALDDAVRAELQALIGGVYHSLGDYEKADRFLMRALAARERIYGEQDQNTLAAVIALSILRKDQDRPKAAETLGRRGLAISRKLHGDDHRDTVASRGNLAAFLSMQSRFDEAEAMYRQNLEQARRLLGPDSNEAINTLSNLAQLFQRRGLPKEALPLAQEVVDRRRKAFGADSPKVAIDLNNLGIVQRELGQLDAAVETYRKALSLSRAVFGEQHPQTLLVTGNLASLHDQRGEREEAERIDRELYEVNVSKHGPDNGATLRAMGNLASVLVHQDKYVEAEPLLLDCVERMRRVHGQKHAETLTGIMNLAVLYERLGRAVEAEELLREAIASGKDTHGEDSGFVHDVSARLGAVLLESGRAHEAQALLAPALQWQKAELGESHRRTLETTLQLGRAYTVLGRDADGEKLFARVIENAKGADGEADARVAMALANLVHVQIRAGRIGEALKTGKKCVELSVKFLGDEDVNTAAARAGYGVALLSAKRNAQAAELLEQALAVQRRELGEDDTNVIGTTANLAAALMQIGRIEEAEPLFLRQIAALIRKEGAESAHVVGVQSNLGRCYLMTGRFEEAAEMYEKSLPIKRKVLGVKHPWTGFAIHGLATAYQQLGRREAAVPLFREVFALQFERLQGPNVPANALNELAWSMLTHPYEEVHDPVKARQLAERACQLAEKESAGDLWQLLDTLALAQHRTGDHEAAVTTQRRAIAVLPAGAAAQKPALERPLETYRQAAAK